MKCESKGMEVRRNTPTPSSPGGMAMGRTWTQATVFWLFVVMCVMGCGSEKRKTDKPEERVSAEDHDMGFSAEKRDKLISADQAVAIALTEFRKREGCSGEAELPIRDGNEWHVIVWSAPRMPGGDCTVTMGEDGTILSYLRGK